MTDARWCATAGSVAHAFVASLDDVITIDGPDGHHLARVRRLRVGEHITASDGDGRWRSYTIVASDRDTLAADATSDTFVEPARALDLCVAFAPTKGGQPEHVVAALTELGVARLQPVHCDRSVVRWDGDRAAKSVARLARVAREAAMLARRCRIPEIGAPITARSLVVGDPTLVIADVGGVAASDLAAAPDRSRAVLVGPEGGFSDAERDAFADAPRLALSPHVLSADTAPIAAAAVLLTR